MPPPDDSLGRNSAKRPDDAFGTWCQGRTSPEEEASPHPEVPEGPMVQRTRILIVLDAHGVLRFRAIDRRAAGPGYRTDWWINP